MWHGLGEVLADYPGREEAMRLAGHDFKIIERPVQVVGNRSSIDVPGWKALVKSGSTDVLNVVRDSYGVVQNDVMWDIVDAIVGEPNVRYETAGVLKAGAVLWVLAWLDEPAQVPGDDSPVYPFVCVSTTHDGTGACQARAVSIRVVCWNTFSAASNQSKSSGLEYTFRHTRNVMDRIADARMALRGVRASHEAFMDLARELAELPVKESARELFLSSMIPLPETALVSDRVARNVDEARAAVRAILNSRTIPEAHRDTGYGLWQAGIEYLDHARGARSSDTKFGRSLLRQEVVKNQLAALVRECVAS